MRWLLSALIFLLPLRVQADQLPPKTPMSDLELARALLAGHRAVFKKMPSGHRIGVAWAQTALETGRGSRARGYNIGNLDNGRARFKSAKDGAVAYWKAISKCAPALGYFDVNDAHGAGLQLARCGYYVASPEQYAAGMASLRQTFNSAVWPKLKSRFGH